MPMTTVLVVFLMLGGWALVSASQQWSARREAYGAAAAAARAGAQGDITSLRSGGVVDADAATARAEAILAASGYAGTVTIDGPVVSVNVTVGVNYAFPAPGFPAAVRGVARATVRRGVTGDEGG